MRIGIFAYNFEHKKTQEGLMHLFLNGYKPECILAADPVELKFYQSKIRISPKGLKYVHPKLIAQKLGIPYHVVAHNSVECHSIIKKYRLELGIILGARILKDDTIAQFPVGVLNMHPGMLPQNRGLDNIKWAVLEDNKQGVSTHLIDKSVDRGRLISRKAIDVFSDDTLLDILLRIQNLELEMMIDALRALEAGKNDFPPVEEGTYHKAVPADVEKGLMRKFEEYKKKYGSL